MYRVTTAKAFTPTPGALIYNDDMEVVGGTWVTSFRAAYVSAGGAVSTDGGNPFSPRLKVPPDIYESSGKSLPTELLLIRYPCAVESP